MAYLYRHIRLDTNEIFYIGIGSDSLGKYKRAYSKYERNKYWQNIVNKTSYEIEIMLDNLTWEEACEKEKEIIKLYGRKDLNEGTLVNMTDGGDGMVGFISKQKGIPLSEEHRRMISKNHADISGSKNPMFGQGHRVIGEKNGFYNKKHSEKTLSILKKPKSEYHKEKLKEAWEERKLRVCECPYCGKIGSENIKKYHFKNCKNKA
jgi:hypothetical protein